MSLQTRLQELVTAVASDYRQLRVMTMGSPTGGLSNLATTDKSSLVGAINEVKNTVVAAAPAGTISAYGGATIPPNWLLCDGAVVSRTTYASLFAAIGTAFGAGDGSTTFALPNLKGRVPFGQDTAQTEFDVIGETGGAKSHTLTVNEMPAHRHYLYRETQPQTWVPDGADGATGGNRWHTADGTANVWTDSVGGGAAHNNTPPYQVVRYIIKFTNGDSNTDSQLTQRVSVVEAGTTSVALAREKARRAQAALYGGGYRKVGDGNFSWPLAFYTMDIGRDTLSPSGYFAIGMPPDGTVIPVTGHATVTSITVGATIAGKISVNSLSAYCALYYELPLGAAATSQPGKFRLVDYSAGTYTIPDSWILIVTRTVDGQSAEWHWADGMQQDRWRDFVHANGWVNYDINNFSPTGWKRSNTGEIIVRGLVKAGAMGAIFAADAARPGPYRRMGFIVSSVGGTARVDVMPDGILVLDSYQNGGSNGFVFLDNIRWFPDGS